MYQLVNVMRPARKNERVNLEKRRVEGRVRGFLLRRRKRLKRLF
jgi:hypothetical protein